MMLLDLDKNEIIEEIKVGGIVYKVGDIQPSIIQKIFQIKGGLGKPSLEKQWRELIPQILERLNGEVDVSKRTKSNISGFISFLTSRIGTEIS